MADGTCSLKPLHVGACRLGERHLLGDAYSDDDRVDFALYSFLVESPGGERTLVDLGPKSLPYANDMFRRYGIFRMEEGEIAAPDDVRQPHGNVFAHLARLGITAADIDHVVFTHFHADHHGIDDARGGGALEDFPRAVFHGSFLGWRYNLDRREHGRWEGYIDHGFADCLRRMEQVGRFHAEDNAEIAPGVRTLYLGGHSVCSQAVCVVTDDGTAIIASDDVYRFDLLGQGMLARLNTSPENLIRATDGLVRLVSERNAILLPVHEPVLWELWKRAGDAWLREVRPLSSQAAEGYAVRRERNQLQLAGVWPM